MRIMINASVLRVGGGVQVADSVCRELYKYQQHQFVVVLSLALDSCADSISHYCNIEVVRYTLPVMSLTTLTGRNKVLDGLVKNRNIDAVLTIFGPSRWIPKCVKISGFARSQLVLPDSPFWQLLSLKQKAIYAMRRIVNRWQFKLSANTFFTENSFISVRLKKLFPKARIYTVTNNYNQVYDHPELWKKDIVLPSFSGLTLLTISANYLHKNLIIIRPTIKILNQLYPELNYRFVLTMMEEQFDDGLTDEERKHIVFIGKTSIDQCPYLYKQSDIMFLPTLLECFSANYAEAMKMEVPILTTDLDFAKSLCSDAAHYFSAISPADLADKIYLLSQDVALRENLKKRGKQRLLCFDTFEQRAEKLIRIVENEYKSSQK